MSKFKVGDRVRVRDDAVVGKSYNGWTLVPLVAGQDVVVAGRGCDYCRVEDPDGMIWGVGDDALRLVLSDEIHITTDGDTVHAIHKQDGKVTSRAKAVCAPGDTFDFAIGAKLAFERVMGITPTEDKPAEPPHFDWELFRTGKQAVNCRTEHDAEVFLAWLAGRGCKWNHKSSLLCRTNWGTYEADTSYVQGYNGRTTIEHAPADYYADKGLAVIPFTREMLDEVDA